jgi:hypothetical protein
MVGMRPSWQLPRAVSADDVLADPNRLGAGIGAKKCARAWMRPACRRVRPGRSAALRRRVLSRVVGTAGPVSRRAVALIRRRWGKALR